MNILVAILAFNIIVIIHELGHFIAAKKSGVKVLEFSLFVGPKIFSVNKNGTMYSLRLIPIMAYVKMEGEEEDSDSEDAFNKKPGYIRALIAFSGPLANLLLAAVLLTAVFSVQGFTTTSVNRVAEDSPAAEAGIKPGDKIVSYDGKRVYLPIDAVQFLYVSKGIPAEVEYVRSGEKFRKTINPTVIPASESPKLGVSLGGVNDADSNVIRALSPGLPAEKMGLMVGDRIIALNGVEIKSAQELIDIVSKNGAKPIAVKALRGDSEVNVTLTPEIVKSQEMYDLGLEFASKSGGVIESLGESAVFTYSIVRSTGYSVVWLITGKARLNELMGPIGMVSTISTAVEQAPNMMEMLLYLMYITALMSIAIGATNLIPFPVLDGGRILLIGIEAIRGKPISREREAFISMIGFGLIILLGIYAAYNDIVRIVTG